MNTSISAKRSGALHTKKQSLYGKISGLPLPDYRLTLNLHDIMYVHCTPPLISLNDGGVFRCLRQLEPTDHRERRPLLV